MKAFKTPRAMKNLRTLGLSALAAISLSGALAQPAKAQIGGDILGSILGDWILGGGRSGSRDPYYGGRDPYYGGRDPYYGGRDPYYGGGYDPYDPYGRYPYDYGNNSRTTLRGQVQSVSSSTNFTLRTDQGRTVRVYSRYSNSNLSVGDYVEVRGTSSSWRFNADSVRVLRDNNDDWDNGYSSTYRGTVTDSSRGRYGFSVNIRGRIYQVRTRNSSTLPNVQSGDQVEIRGRMTGQTIHATSVRVLNNWDDDWNDGYNRTLSGRVVSTQYDGFTLRDTSGRTYRVRTNGTGISVRSGDYVQVRGSYRNGVFYATSVNRDGGWDGNDAIGYGQQVRLDGRVQSVSSNSFVVRDDDDGRTYRVYWRNASNYEVGDLVRVDGRLNGNTITATDVDKR